MAPSASQATGPGLLPPGTPPTIDRPLIPPQRSLFLFLLVSRSYIRPLLRHLPGGSWGGFSCAERSLVSRSLAHSHWVSYFGAHVGALAARVDIPWRISYEPDPLVPCGDCADCRCWLFGGLSGPHRGTRSHGLHICRYTSDGAEAGWLRRHGGRINLAPSLVTMGGATHCPPQKLPPNPPPEPGFAGFLLVTTGRATTLPPKPPTGKRLRRFLVRAPLS